VQYCNHQLNDTTRAITVTDILVKHNSTANQATATKLGGYAFVAERIKVKITGLNSVKISFGIYALQASVFVSNEYNSSS